MDTKGWRDVRSLMADGLVDVDLAIYIVVEACRALAHEAGVPTPSTIRLGPAGDVRVVTDISEMPCIPPEMFERPIPPRKSTRVEPQPVTEQERARANVFMLGCVLWEMLMGRRPYASGDISSMQTANIPPLDNAPSELAAIVAKAVARDPVARYETPNALASALTDYLVARAAPN